MPPNRRSSRRPAEPADAPEPAQESTRIKSGNARRAPPPQEEEEQDPYATSEEQYPEEDESGDTSDEGEEGLPFSGDDDDNPDATRAGPPLTLEIIEGPDKGTRKRFKSVRMVIGRGQDCEVTLLDQSVSRRHVELVYDGANGVMLRDLVSGNGTRVNDERVDERKLNHEDVIAIGRTKLRFVDEGERIKQKRQAADEAERKQKEEAERKQKEEEERKQKAAEAANAGAPAGDAPAGSATAAEAGAASKDGGTQIRDVRNIPRRAPAPTNPVGLIVAGVLVLVLVLVSVGVLMGKRGPPPPPPPNPKQEKARGMLQEARNAFRRGDYSEAVNLAVEADSVFPGVDNEGFLVAARTELGIVESFTQARTLMGQNKFEEARALLEDAPHGTAQSTETLRETLTTDLAAAELAYLIKQVEVALEEGDPQRARALIQKLPLERQPLYLGKVSELETQLAQDVTNAASQDRAARAAAARRAKEQRDAFVASAFSTVQSRFHASDFPRAVLECDRVVDANAGDKEIRERAKTLKKLIPQFSRFFQDGQRKMQSNALESAARSLRSAAELYRQIGLPGPIGDTLDNQLAVSAVAAGRASLDRGDVANAATFFGEALRLRPDDSRAQAGMTSLQAKLQGVYNRAYMLKDRDPEGSAEQFRLVFKLAPEGSDLKSRAEAQLASPQGDALPSP